MKRALIRGLDWLDVAGLMRRFRRQDVVLLYHSVENEPSGFRHSVSTSSFAAHLRYLVRHYRVVSLETMFQRRDSASRVAITFDDAYEELYRTVYPLVLELQAPMTIFVPTYFTETGQRLLAEYGPGSDKTHLTWEQMREMQASGLVHLESHTHTHLDAVAQIARLEADIRTSRELLEKHLGRRPRYLAYPFGNCSAETHRIVLGSGFERVFTTESVPVRGQTVEGRIDIERMNEPLDYFKLAAAGINTFAIRKALRGRAAHGVYL